MARKLKLAIITAGLTIASATCFAAPPYPSSPITLIVPYAPGGNLDVTTRLIAPYLSKELGDASIVVMNKAGAGGSLGAAYTARSKPDGYTVLVTATTELSVTPYITNANYSVDDFDLVGSINTVPMIIEVRHDSKYQSGKELMDDVCANPGKVTMGIAGFGSVNFMALRQLQEVTGCKFTMVPYTGSGPALIGLVSGQTDAIIDQISSSKPFLDDKRIKPLIALSDDPIADYPSTPSLSKLGIKGADMATVAALVVPKGTPVDVRKKLNEALRKVTNNSKVRESMEALGGSPFTAEHDNFMQTNRTLATLAAKYKAAGTLTAD